MYLLNVLGVLIGFATVMLLLSLVVTGLVQAVLVVAGFRRRNLLWGLERLLRSALKLNEQQSRDGARKVIETIITGTTVTDPNAASQNPAGVKAAIHGWLSRLWNPAPTWIKPEEIVQRLKDAGQTVEAPATVAEVEGRFKQSEDYLCKRFAYHVRFVTVPIAFVIAAAFQLSSIELIERLSKDAEFRQSLVAEGEALVAQSAPTAPTATAVARTPHHQDVASSALETLRKNHPKLADQLKDVQGVGYDREAVIGEVEDALAELPNAQRDVVVNEYEKLVDDAYRKAIDTAAKDVGGAYAKLTSLKVDLWPRGWAFFGNLTNILGVAITGVLLTFGAPFWFEMLGQLLRLKDVMTPPKPKDGTPSPPAPGPQ